MQDFLMAGAAMMDITPRRPMFLFGYPHVPRLSTGTHDPLLASALYLSDGRSAAIFVANDVIYISQATAASCRQRIAEQTGMPSENIMLTATHTHSGPVTVDILACEADPMVPKVDPDYLRQLEDGIVAAAVKAVGQAQPAEAGLVMADATGIGTNRRDPAGARNLQVPALLVRSRADGRYLAAMLVCCMHPTVLHEDSTLFSGDFPAMARAYLQQKLLGADCPVPHHTGPCGNQSPRHVVRGQTFAEAQRLGEILGQSVIAAAAQVSWERELPISSATTTVDLPPRQFASPAQARQKLREVVARLEKLRQENAPRAMQRTAECDWFGAEETVTLAQAQASGRLERIRRAVMPAQVQVIGIGPWRFIGWPGEVFVEFGLTVQARFPQAFVITMANGQLQGYLVTQQAVDEGGYEASNSVFQCPAGGEQLVQATMRLLDRM